MAASSVAERFHLAQLVATQSWTSAGHALRAPKRLLASLRAPAPSRLLIAPQDIRTADPTIADEIYAGYFALGPKGVSIQGRSPFEIVPPSAAWAAALAGFGWLRHLRAADTALSRANARSLVEDWIGIAGRPDGSLGWSLPVTARRLLSWLSQSPIILDGADRSFYRRFMRSLGQHAVALQNGLADRGGGESRLLAAIALAELALCADGLSALQRRSMRLLAVELSRQILADGGHIGRNPQALVDFLLDLLPLRQAFAARGQAAPPVLLNSIDRMMPMLRMFRHGDGNLALFNGMSTTAPDLLATVLAYDDAQARPLQSAPICGYQRVEAGRSLMLLDAGAPPPPVFSTHAHAGLLSFEFSYDAQRLVVNCGAPGRGRPDLAEASRVSAAHSTLVIGDVSSCRFAGHAGRLGRWLDGQIVAGPARVDVARRDERDAVTLTASHDGYDRRFGLRHTRVLRLSSDGLVLEGEDSLTPTGRRVPGAVSAEYAIRFHLHPSVRLETPADRVGLFLVGSAGERWRFAADGPPLAIEEGLFFANLEGPRPAEQIAIHADLKEARTVRWTLRRESA